MEIENSNITHAQFLDFFISLSRIRENVSAIFFFQFSFHMNVQLI